MQIDGDIQIKDGSMPPTKLELPNDSTKFLNGVGEFVEVVNSGTGGATPGAKLLRFSGIVGEDGIIPSVTNTMLGLDGKDLTQEKIICVAYYGADTFAVPTSIHSDQIGFSGNVAEIGSVWVVTVAIEGEVSGETGGESGGTLPNGNLGNTLYNNGTDWTASNSINITQDESGESVIMRATFTTTDQGGGGLE